MGLHDIPVTTSDGRATTMAEWAGRTLLVVNVATHCGYTTQLAGLEALWRRYRDRGLVVLGFPCDQFLHQAPGSAAEIAAQCVRTHAVTFPMMEKVAVNGAGAHPLYRLLTHARRGRLWTRSVKWNFTKFLVWPDGTVAHRFAPSDSPEVIGRVLAERLGD